jgi:hypothetical protein
MPMSGLCQCRRWIPYGATALLRSVFVRVNRVIVTAANVRNRIRIRRRDFHRAWEVYLVTVRMASVI